MTYTYDPANWISLTELANRLKGVKSHAALKWQVLHGKLTVGKEGLEPIEPGTEETAQLIEEAKQLRKPWLIKVTDPNVSACLQEAESTQLEEAVNVSALQKKVQELEQTLSNAEYDTSVQMEAAIIAREELEKAEKRIKELEEQAARLNAEIERLSGISSTLKTENQDLTITNASLTAALKESRANNSQLASMFSSANVSLQQPPTPPKKEANKEQVLNAWNAYERECKEQGTTPNKTQFAKDNDVPRTTLISWIK